MTPQDRSPTESGAPDPLERALDARGLRDPRGYYRELLKKLKAKDSQAYGSAVAYHDERLRAGLDREDVDAVEEWVEYGRYLANLLAPGRTWSVDPTGLAEPYCAPPAADALVLHLPDAAGERGLVLSAPKSLTPPQKATYDLLAR
jgi:hypothetical protein